MFKVLDVANVIEKLCPRFLAEDWDNVGLLIGDKNNVVNKILICLDVDAFVVDEAIKNNVDLIVSHHPAIFNPLKSITKNDNNWLINVIKNDISVYSAHTNLDVAVGGLNDYLAKTLNLCNTKILVKTQNFNDNECGYGRIATLENPIVFKDYLDFCVKKLNLSNTRYCGDLNKIIKTVAVNCGGGASMANDCFDKNIDLYITGDFKYSKIRECYEKGLAIIDAGHYETEIIAIDLFYEIITQSLDIECIKSKQNINIINSIN